MHIDRDLTIGEAELMRERLAFAHAQSRQVLDDQLAMSRELQRVIGAGIEATRSVQELLEELDGRIAELRNADQGKC